jgi:hypothetical protein
MDFPNAVRKSLGLGFAVPCSAPFTGVQLLQLIEHGNVDGYGLLRRKHVFTNPGDDLATFIDYVLTCDLADGDKTDFGLGVELEKLVSHANACATRKSMPMNVSQWAVLKTGFHASISLEDEVLADIGFKAKSDLNWTLSFGEDNITRKSISRYHFIQLVLKNRIPWSNVMNHYKGVVTAIFCVTGGLRYTGRAKRVLMSGVHKDPTQAPIRITAGWQYVVTNTQEVVLSEINPDDWIIAIEYKKLVPIKRGTLVGFKPKRKYFFPDRYWQ